jgi:hypothetical protein
MLNKESVENFCFDVLGDFIDPKADIEVEQVRGEFRVLVLRTRGIPKDIIRDEWNRNAKGTDFEKVSLYL